MIKLPNRPFTTDDFSLRGGGIDFLGLRWVNLTILYQDLIPEINNVTVDMGTFFLAGWIPWKFCQLCQSGNDYTEQNYRAFREKVEVAFSLTLRNDLEIARDCGQVRNRVGITQENPLPGKLNFEQAKRSDQNSVYAAAIYGPSLQALGLIKTYHSQAKNAAMSLEIPVSGDDQDTIEIVNGVDASLKTSTSYNLLASLESPEFKAYDIRNLASTGLDPTRFRGSGYSVLKACFRRKLLPSHPKDPGYARTLTGQLLLATLRQRSRLITNELRNTWYSGMFDDGQPLLIIDTKLEQHRKRWACFIARQYQRYAIELFLWCFEKAISHGHRSIEDVVHYWEHRSTAADLSFPRTFGDLLQECAVGILQNDELQTSKTWNDKVHAGDSRFEYVEEPRNDRALISALRMIAGWYWRMLVRQQDAETSRFMKLGGSD